MVELFQYSHIFPYIPYIPNVSHERIPYIRRCLRGSPHFTGQWRYRYHGANKESDSVVKRGEHKSNVTVVYDTSNTMFEREIHYEWAIFHRLGDQSHLDDPMLRN